MTGPAADTIHDPSDGRFTAPDGTDRSGLLDAGQRATLGLLRAALRAEFGDDDGRIDGGCYLIADHTAELGGWQVRFGTVATGRCGFTLTRRNLDDAHRLCPQLPALLGHAAIAPDADEVDAGALATLAAAVAEDESACLAFELLFGDHVWFETPDGTIVDPTAEQFGGEPATIVVTPDDPDRWRWLAR